MNMEDQAIKYRTAVVFINRRAASGGLAVGSLRPVLASGSSANHIHITTTTRSQPTQVPSTLRYSLYTSSTTATLAYSCAQSATTVVTLRSTAGSAWAASNPAYFGRATRQGAGKHGAHCLKRTNAGIACFPPFSSEGGVEGVEGVQPKSAGPVVGGSCRRARMCGLRLQELCRQVKRLVHKGPLPPTNPAKSRFSYSLSPCRACVAPLGLCSLGTVCALCSTYPTNSPAISRSNVA
ncbi:hypothetical protein F4808DRAFT_21820 [Astrocystis sublimbata]|nr:hypothetical protein F4808DRAFT_21820 [Astrocystis sublimbata]